MKLGMVEPTDYAGDFGNPGWWFINLGTRNLLRQAFPNVEFVSLPMRRPWCDVELRNAKECDGLALVGNPRYDGYSVPGSWLYEGLIKQMEETGLPIFDLWSGVGLPDFSCVDEDARTLLSNPRNAKLVREIKHFKGVITRDSRAQRVNEISGIRSINLPCSSWWSVAKQYVGTKRTILVNQYIPDIDNIIKFSAEGWEVVCSRPGDVDWCKSFDVECRLLRSPAQHLKCYQESEELISYRLHAGIPAASLGCKVSVIGSDSRMQACDSFDIPWSVMGNEIKKPKLAREPASIVERIKEFINAY